MKSWKILYVLLILVFILASCSPENKEAEKPSLEKAKVTRTKLGGCVLLSPLGQVPDNLYQETEIVPAHEYKPFTKKLMVYGLTLIARDEISDDFMKKVAKTVKEMFPQEGEGLDSELQKKLLRNLYRYRATIPLFKGREHEFSPEDEKAWAKTRSQNSICDIIMEGVSGQVNEVVEHILHHVTDVGFHYTFPHEWGISTSSKLYQVMQAAIDNKYYDITQYNRIPDEERNRVLLQEFAYWIIYTSWDLRKIYGPMQAEWSIMTAAELKEKLPQAWQLFEETVPKVMNPPKKATLEEFKAYEVEE
ncbi:MAG: hypothetical protein ACE5GI_03655 [Candidatus Aminicenantales bacterium]